MSARATLLALAVSLAPLAAAGQESGLALDAAFGYQDLTAAKDSAKAVFDGSSGGFTFGGGVRYAFKSGLFVGGFGRYFSKDGERVFVESPGGEVFRLGHPLSLRLIPIQGSVGWRFGVGSFRPYVAGGAGVTSYHEESTVGGISESASETKFSFHVLGGVEYGHGSLSFAGEVMWLAVPDSLGIGGVSKVYGESDVGGLSIVGKVVFTLGGH